MKESIHAYFQVSNIQQMSHPLKSYDLLDSLKAIACDDSFDAIDIT